MECNCMKENENIYYKCRKEAASFNENLFSRERASEILGISVSTLSNYELGLTNPPVDIVVKMAELYNAPQITGRYCKNACPIGRTMPVATNVTSLERATLKIMKCLKQSQIEEIRDELVNIAADGEIGPDEVDKLKEILEKLEDMSEAISELKMLAKKKLK